MFDKRRIILFTFWVITIVDLYNCLISGQQFNQILRPIQMFVLLVWVLTKTQFSLIPILIAIALVIAAVADYVFYRYGSSNEYGTILLIILKNFFFFGILYLRIKITLCFSKKLCYWAFRYVIFLIIICFLMAGFDNGPAYIIAIQSGIILLLISLQKNNSVVFNQLYFGYALIILSLIFGKILLTDSRWFIETIDRFSYVFGHLLFITGLANIKLLIRKSNISEYQTVE